VRDYKVIDVPALPPSCGAAQRGSDAGYCPLLFFETALDRDCASPDRPTPIHQWPARWRWCRGS